MNNREDRYSRTLKFSYARSIIDGMLASSGEMLACYPLWTLKTRYQIGQPPCLKISTLYRGFFAASVLDLPIITTQVLANDLYASTFSQNNNANEKLCFSALGGATSSLIATPVEQVITVQHSCKLSFRSAYQKVISGGYHRLMTGALAFAIQEAGFSMCYISMIPSLLEAQSDFSFQEIINVYSRIVLASIVTSIITQPFDRLKTHQQANFDKSANSMILSAIAVLREEGYAGFFKGAGFRTARVVLSTSIMGSILHSLRPNA